MRLGVLTAFLIVLIFVPLNGAYMRVYIGHIWGQQWGMRAYIGHMGAAMGHACAHTWAIYGSHGPYMGAYMGHMGAAMGHACAHTWAIYGAAL